ncbi:MAG: DUF3347 domain-containing protein [Flavobacterium sp.]
MKKYITQLQLLTLLLLFLINFSVQGQPPPPGLNYGEIDEVDIVNSVQKHNSKELSAFKAPNNSESFSNANLKESNLDKIYKTFLCMENNLRLSNSEKAKLKALVLLLTENIEQSLDAELFDQIKTNAKLICATNDLNEQRHYFSLISDNMQQLLSIQIKNTNRTSN